MCARRGRQASELQIPLLISYRGRVQARSRTQNLLPATLKWAFLFQVPNLPPTS